MVYVVDVDVELEDGEQWARDDITFGGCTAGH
jgi:hypothetical protein